MVTVQAFETTTKNEMVTLSLSNLFKKIPQHLFKGFSVVFLLQVVQKPRAALLLVEGWQKLPEALHVLQQLEPLEPLEPLEVRRHPGPL